jgi:MoxR-like ATPase
MTTTPRKSKKAASKGAKAPRRTKSPRQKPEPIPEIQPAVVARRLGIVGWTELDPVLLAALATEIPLLLVGEHGLAKSLIVERVAQAMGMKFAHYNAALINYDDLVGIPMPKEDSDELVFARTPAAIWGVEFAFMDEISRARVDLQNKLFPIIHERRVMGMPLGDLKYRWSAMNPPMGSATDDDEEDPIAYLGSEELDPALADRFGFVVPVPRWSDLSAEEKEQLLDPSSSPADMAVEWLPELVQETRRLMPLVESLHGKTAVRYVCQLIDQLSEAKVHFSPRRGRLLTEGIVAVHAASLALGRSGDCIKDSAWLMLQNAFPHTATSNPVPMSKALVAHQCVVDVLDLPEHDPMKELMFESDPVQRVLIAERTGMSDYVLARLVTDAISRCRTRMQRVALAVGFFLRFRNVRPLDPATYELLAANSRNVIFTGLHYPFTDCNLDSKAHAALVRHLAKFPEVSTHREMLICNFLREGAIGDWEVEDLHTAEAHFRSVLQLLAPADYLNSPYFQNQKEEIA